GQKTRTVWCDTFCRDEPRISQGAAEQWSGGRHSVSYYGTSDPEVAGSPGRRSTLARFHFGKALHERAGVGLCKRLERRLAVDVNRLEGEHLLFVIGEDQPTILISYRGDVVDGILDALMQEPLYRSGDEVREARRQAALLHVAVVLHVLLHL